MKGLANLMGVIAGIVMILLGLLAVGSTVYGIIELGFDWIRLTWKGLVIGFGFLIAGIGSVRAGNHNLTAPLAIGVIMAVLEWKVWTGAAFINAEILLALINDTLCVKLLYVYDYIIIGIIVCCAIGLVAQIVATSMAKKPNDNENK